MNGINWHTHNERERLVYGTCPRGHEVVTGDQIFLAGHAGKLTCNACEKDGVVSRADSVASLLKMCNEVERIFAEVREASEEAAARQLKWDRVWLAKARDISLLSKDPSTKTGAVIIGPDGDLVSVGYNGFARGVEDLPERYADREVKYKMVVHCTDPSHRTLTKDLRWVEQGSLKVGDELVAFDEYPPPGKLTRSYRRAVVERVEFDKSPTFRVVLSTGQELLTTADHRWLTTTRVARSWKWQRTDELRPASSYKGSYVTTVAQVLPVFETATDYDSGWLAGLIDGEGHLGEHHTIHFAQRPGIVLDTAIEVLKRKSLLHSIRLVDDVMRGGLGKGDTRNVHIRGKLPERLALLGSIRPKRLLAKVDPDSFGRMRRRDKEGHSHTVLRVEPAGEREIVKVTTSTGTMFVEGYPMHNCEVNAILFADRWRLKGATLYTWPFMCCSNCAAVVIQAGITRCVAPPIPADQASRWAESIQLAQMQFEEAGVELLILPDEQEVKAA